MIKLIDVVATVLVVVGALNWGLVEVMAADVVKVSSAKAVSNDTLAIKVSGGTVMVDKARVVKTDNVASNGVIHVVDTVLLPPEE